MYTFEFINIPKHIQLFIHILQIDYDLPEEYLQVLDDRGNQLGDNCNGGDGCIQWATCLDRYSIGRSRIIVGDTIKFTVVQSDQVHALCLFTAGHTYSINARIDLYCQGGTAQPTSPSQNPTKEPSTSPTSPTLNPTPLPSTAPTMPTADPTQSPTYLTTTCGTQYEFCIHAEIYPNLDDRTEFNVPIQYIDVNQEVVFHVYFQIGNSIDCVSPKCMLHSP